MTAEFDIYGVFVPSLFIWLLIALILHLALRRAMRAVGVYRFVWHQPLFDGALYVIILYVTVLFWATFVK